MGRIFTIEFQFQQEVYTALVSLTLKGNDLAFQINVHDSRLHHLLPEGNAYYHRNKNGLEVAEESNHQLSQELLQCIADAIDKYLQAFGAIKTSVNKPPKQ